MSTKPKAYPVRGGIGPLAATALMIRDGKLLGGNISTLEEMPVMGRSMNGVGDPEGGYSLRGGRMPGSAGQKVDATSNEDEDDEGRSDSERWVEEGVAEAEHDQMVQVATAEREEDARRRKR